MLVAKPAEKDGKMSVYAKQSHRCTWPQTHMVSPIIHSNAVFSDVFSHVLKIILKVRLWPTLLEETQRHFGAFLVSKAPDLSSTDKSELADSPINTHDDSTKGALPEFGVVVTKNYWNACNINLRTQETPTKPVRNVLDWFLASKAKLFQPRLSPS